MQNSLHSYVRCSFYYITKRLKFNHCLTTVNATCNACSFTARVINIIIILEWTTSLDTSSRTLFVREGGRMSVHVTSNVELRNYVTLLLNVELRNYVISHKIVI